MTPAAFEIEVPADAEDGVIAALHETGTNGVEVRTAGPSILLVAYFDDADGLDARVGAAVDETCPTARVRRVPVPEVDWIARFRETFRAFRAGSFLIAPAWDPPPAAEGVLLVEPGQAFGTGTHETTRLCLTELEALAPLGLGPVADVGTGTAILAIAACRLGARGAVAVDNDPEALAVARRHLELNPAPVLLVQGDGGRPLRPRRFQTVIANVTAPLLVARAHEIACLAASGGRLVLSGLLAEDVEEVRAAYAPYGAVTVRREKEWAALRVEIQAGTEGR